MARGARFADFRSHGAPSSPSRSRCDAYAASFAARTRPIGGATLVVLAVVAGLVSTPLTTGQIATPLNGPSSGPPYTGACLLLPDEVPILSNGSANASFPIGPHPPPNFNGSSGYVPPGPWNTTWNVTVGEVRAFWGQVCTDPRFVNTSSVQPARNFSFGGYGNVRTGNATLEVGFNWAAICDVNFVPPPGVNFTESVPNYNGPTMCSWYEYWPGQFLPNQTVVIGQPSLGQFVAAYGGASSPGAVSPASPTGPGAIWATLLAIAIAGVAIALAVTWSTRSGRGGEARAFERARRSGSEEWPVPPAPTTDSTENPANGSSVRPPSEGAPEDRDPLADLI